MAEPEIYSNPQRLLALADNIRIFNNDLRTELEGMNTSIEEESLEPDAPLEPVSFNLDDIERVYLVGVEVKRKRSSVTKFSGSFRHL